MIREARPSDMNKLLWLAEQFLKPSTLPFDPVAISQSISTHILCPRKCLFVAEKDGKVVGAIAGCKEVNFLGVMMASETILFVDQEHRGRAGLALIKAFEDWASPLPVMMNTRLDFHKDNRLDQLLERKGYKAIETHYMKV
jgi:GNAT superfamily N-acetyltransferase